LKKSTAPIYSRLQTLHSSEDNLEHTINDFSHALPVYSDISTEISIKIGAKLLHELLLSNAEK